MKYFKVFTARIAKHPKVKFFWNDLRENPGYARYGFQSVLLAVCITAYGHTILPDLGIETFVWLYTHPVMKTLDTLIFEIGYIMAFVMGLVGIVRPALPARVLGVAGVIISYHFCCQFGGDIPILGPLWSLLLWEVPFWSYMIFIAVPASLAYEMAAGNEILGAFLFITPPFLFWAVVRKRVLKSLLENRSNILRHSNQLFLLTKHFQRYPK